MLLFIIYYPQEGLTHSFEGTFVDILDRIVERMPLGYESATGLIVSE